MKLIREFFWIMISKEACHDLRNAIKKDETIAYKIKKEGYVLLTLQKYHFPFILEKLIENLLKGYHCEMKSYQKKKDGMLIVIGKKY